MSEPGRSSCWPPASTRRQSARLPERLALCLVLPATALLLRIRVEEAALRRIIGDPYRAYEKHTKRLIPGLW